jgi:2,3-bisphosphoglycerate-dependent phosphoglycerate mutase
MSRYGRLALIRHAETDGNKFGLIYGQLDRPLNETGRQQLARAAAMLREQEFTPDIVFTTPLGRGSESAELIVRELGLAQSIVREEHRLIARHYGIWQGRSPAAIAEEVGRPWIDIFREYFWDGPPGGESWQSLLDRIKEFLDDAVLPNLLHGNNVMIIGHNAGVRVFLGLLHEAYKDWLIELQVPGATPLLYQIDATRQLTPLHTPFKVIPR